MVRGVLLSGEEAAGYLAIGEISPQYLYCEECPGRISAALPAVKLLVMLRHPVDRAYSNYGFVVQRANFRGSFEEFLVTRPSALEKGFYSRHLDRYLRHFDRSQILALLFEEAMADGDAARGALAGFLNIPVDRFPPSLGRVNPSTVPRFRTLSGLAVKTGRRLRRKNLESLVDLGGRLGVRRLLTKGRSLPRLDAESRRHLSQRYADEFAELETTLQIDLSSWRT